jgi:hypothetical protein
MHSGESSTPTTNRKALLCTIPNHSYWPKFALATIDCDGTRNTRVTSAACAGPTASARARNEPRTSRGFRCIGTPDPRTDTLEA